MTLVTTVEEARSVFRNQAALSIPLRVRYWVCFLALVASDALAFWLSANLFRSGQAMPNISLEPRTFVGELFHGGHVDVFALLAVGFLFVRAAMGDYSRRKPFWEEARAITASLIVASTPDLAWVCLRNGFSPMDQVASWLFLLISLPALRHVTRVALHRAGLWKRCAALIGDGPQAQSSYLALKRSLSLGLDIQWLVTLNGSAKVASEFASLKRICASSALDAAPLVRAAGCDQAIIAAGDIGHSAFPELVKGLHESDIEFGFVPSLGGMPLANITTNVLFGRNILFFQVNDNLRRRPLKLFKRLFDIVVSAILLVVLSPLFLVVFILIKREDGGPATYLHRRVGREGREFNCIKFRTMVFDADEHLQRWKETNAILYEEFLKSHKLKGDPRVTPIGRWLRRTSLDELPQLLNVLRGDMSLVGPRPVVQRELEEFYESAARLYMSVRPGMTGMWQVSGRSQTSYAERIAYDEWYILNWSIWYDIVVLAQTVMVVILGQGAL